MIEFLITDQMRTNAQLRSKNVGSLPGSFMEGQRNIIGFLGEEIFNKWRPDAIKHDNVNYDFLSKNKRIDVKSSIISVVPKVSYDMTIKISKKKKLDIFVFIMIHSSHERGWILGWLTATDFYSKVEEIQAGAIRPNGGIYKSAGLRIFINQMNQVN